MARACTSGQAGWWAVGGALTGLDTLSSIQPLLKERGVAVTRAPLAGALDRVGGQGGLDRACCAPGDGRIAMWVFELDTTWGNRRGSLLRLGNWGWGFSRWLDGCIHFLGSGGYWYCLLLVFREEFRHCLHLAAYELKVWGNGQVSEVCRQLEDPWSPCHRVRGKPLGQVELLCRRVPRYAEPSLLKDRLHDPQDILLHRSNLVLLEHALQ